MRSHSSHGRRPISSFCSTLDLFQIKFTRACNIFSKKRIIDSLSGQSIKMNSSLHQQFIRLIHYFIFILVKFEVELPGAYRIWDITIFIGNRKSDLDHFGLFYITLHQKVFAFLFGIVALIVFASGGDDAGELGILCNEGSTMAMTLKR